MTSMDFSGLSAAYSDLISQKNMLMDDIRTGGYYKGFSKCNFKDKIVLDVGAGTGILSIFAAKAGAKRVHAVEMSGIFDKAIELVNHNKVNDIVKLHHGKIQDIDIGEQVDIIISEWMGMFLFHERMAETIIYARDKYLKPNGLMLPSHVELFFALYQSKEEIERFRWNALFFHQKNYFGVDFTVFNKYDTNQKSIFRFPIVKILEPKKVISNPVSFSYDMKTIKLEDISFSKNISLSPTAQGSHFGVAVWFDTFFKCNKDSSSFSTGPFTKGTHWQQGLLIIKDPIPYKPNENIDLNVSFLPKSTFGYLIDLTVNKNKHAQFDTDYYFYSYPTPHGFFQLY